MDTFNLLAAAGGATLNVGSPGGIPTDLGVILSWAIRMIFLFAGLIVAYNIIQGGLDWVQSGGEK
ncbi:MAG: hypothetical protein NUV52_00740, partial [Candidatus Roizmanbacteria bacterium]|nr:hypothetical protein [Candidatus Roizmanbacteria bacterium]